MKSFARLHCDQQTEISQGILDFVMNQTTVLTTGDLGWNFVDTRSLLQHVPALGLWFKSLSLMPRHSAITVIRNNDQLPLHIDEAPVVAKINFPVLNTVGWANRWYHIEPRVLQECPQHTNQFGNLVHDLSGIPQDQITLCDELLDMPWPIVFNSGRAHSVEMVDPVGVPRIVASFTFFREPVELLQ